MQTTQKSIPAGRFQLAAGRLILWHWRRQSRRQQQPAARIKSAAMQEYRANAIRAAVLAFFGLGVC